MKLHLSLLSELVVKRNDLIRFITETRENSNEIVENFVKNEEALVRKVANFHSAKIRETTFKMIIISAKCSLNTVWKSTLKSHHA